MNLSLDCSKKWSLERKKSMAVTPEQMYILGNAIKETEEPKMDAFPWNKHIWECSYSSERTLPEHWMQEESESHLRLGKN